jgi:photosystem I P700 chlorophyll a apoprotein A1
MHFHGAYFANYSCWLKDAKHSLPSSHLVYPLVGQDILNDYNGNQYSSAIRITSGFFQLWRSEGIVTQVHLKYAACASLIGTIICCTGSYFHMHMLSTSLFHKKFSSLSIHHLVLMSGLGCISYAAHQIHISLPVNSLLDSGVIIPLSEECAVNADLMETLFPGFGVGPKVNFALYLPSSHDLFNPSTASIFLGQIAFHHFALGVVFIIVGLIGYLTRNSISLAKLQHSQKTWHSQLSINLAVCASCSIVFAHHVYAMPVYPFCSSDYATVLCLFCHHMWIGAFLIIGAGAHASIREIREAHLPICINSLLTAHRDVIIGHLIWVTIYLGFHSFGLYVHNDTLQALRRPEDTFCDNSIQLKPVFAAGLNLQPYIFVLDKKLVSMTLELATADYMMHSLHAFTIHVTLLILLKGVLYARSSRLVSDKLELGFRYPCDGPGRGGTCQISPWDHLYLAVFWMYNSLSIVIFHFFWKMQSDVWGVYDTHVAHISSCDFSVHSTTINGWLRNFLWSQAAQAIQSYATSISGYSLIFIGAHFIWAFSLMFLYSGRGYWQELIESILWAHHKLKIVPHIQPRALSISQGRAVGLTHYILGGISTTWAFFISRMVAIG